ncbi:Archaeophage PsiM2, terminase large subunit [uncultured Caudovirales phage]|uniref:Archaeophage PsiM2, terminase large subunit n=1 Tax=uncultured Caudovirales phage TaxID=2100421 RepID=A0A6J5MV70_9CAUD|nr:Archaeophage PsiM2, terminase large subunit [uncultured Caudovirales phage]
MAAVEYELAVAKKRCTDSHLDFTRYFFKHRQQSKFLINWHHEYICDELEKVITGETENLVINVPPGSSKTETAVINFIARGLAKNPRARFLHLSYSDDLALLNSQTAREMIRSEEYQKLWPLQIAGDTKSKKRWNVLVNGKLAGGVYATSMSGQITGFRAGWMTEGFQGAILIDDPLKPEDASSKVKLKAANRRLLTTVKSRKANPKTPIILIMQRLHESDPTGFIKKGNLPGKWRYVTIPAMIDDAYVAALPEKYQEMIDGKVRDKLGRFSYWEYKEPIAELQVMAKGEALDDEGNLISRAVFNSQYQQHPVALGGNVIKGADFVRYTILPKIKYRIVYADTAQKTAERNDFSVFQCWGYGVDGKIYLLDQIRGKWEAPELQRRARAFWAKQKGEDIDKMGFLRRMMVEDKSSGTGLIQSLRLGDATNPAIPVKGIERSKDKFSRVNDGLPYIEAHMVCIPQDAPWTNDYIAEMEAFTPDDTHEHDDQIDPTIDAISDMLSTNNKLKTWERLGE